MKRYELLVDQRINLNPSRLEVFLEKIVYEHHPVFLEYLREPVLHN